MRNFKIYSLLILMCVFGLTSCEEDDIDQAECPVLSFSAQQETNTNLYYFEMRTEGLADDDTLSWFVNDEFVQGFDQTNETTWVYRFEPGTYEICVKTETPDCPTGTSYCEKIIVEETDDTPNDCPTLSFTPVLGYEDSSLYNFEVRTDGLNDDAVLFWTINGEITQDIDPINDTDWVYRFEPGRYEVCVGTETPECPSGTSFCKVIVVEESEEDCPTFSFEAEQEGTGPIVYFNVSKENTDEDYRLSWSIDGVYTQDIDQINDTEWLYRFEPGRYEVCIATETPDCPRGTSFCKVIEVKEDVTVGCPDLNFAVTRDDNGYGYYFETSNTGLSGNERLEWFIDGEYVQGVDQVDDSRWYYQFDPGTYEVCIGTETPNCPTGTTFCKTITVDTVHTQVCPDLYFDAEQDGSNLAYYFNVDFDGADDLSWLGFYINDDYVQDIDLSNNRSLYYQFSAGTYEICIKTETPGCPSGVSYCKTIVIQ